MASCCLWLGLTATSLLLLCGLQVTGAVRFAIVSLVAGPVYPPYYAQGVTNRALYATRHNYVLRVYDRIDHDRPTAWSKVLALKSTIRSGHFDWLFWLDSDALITNFETHLDEFLPSGKEGEEVDLVVSADCNGINTGVFMLRCSPSSLQLLEDLYSGPHVTNETIVDRWWEQKSLIHLYETSEKVQSQTLVVPQKAFNSYHQGAAGCGEWTEGDFIVHLPGLGDEEREMYIGYYLSKVLEHG